jgi:hypothetical protein
MRLMSLGLRARSLPRFGSLVLVLVAVAALSVPLAQARRDFSGSSAVSVNLRPDDRGGVRVVGSGQAVSGVVSRPLHADDRAGPRGLDATLETAPTLTAGKTVIVEVDGFQWLDAGIGAATVFAGMMLIVGVALLLRRQRSTPRPT